MQRIFAAVIVFFTLLPCATGGRGQENVYVAALKAYLQENGPEDLKYLSFALGDIELIDADKLEKALQKYCGRHNIEVLPNSDYQWLKKNGDIFFTGEIAMISPTGRASSSEIARRAPRQRCGAGRLRARLWWT